MKKKKHPLSIIEMMIVIALIGIITAVIGYNMQGALNRGKIKQTELAIQKVRDILELEYSLNHNLSLEQLANTPQYYLKRSGLVKEPSKLLKDGWGDTLQVQVQDGALVVYSENYPARRQNAKNHEQNQEVAKEREIAEKQERNG
ncbi:MAG: type II secretion system protein [Chlamydiota bacterium]